MVIRAIGERAQTSDGQVLDAALVRAAAGLPADRFGAALIGKDGGIKLHRAAPLDPGELFSVIDAMPMRQDEMKRAAGR